MNIHQQFVNQLYKLSEHDLYILMQFYNVHTIDNVAECILENYHTNSASMNWNKQIHDEIMGNLNDLDALAYHAALNPELEPMYNEIIELQKLPTSELNTKLQKAKTAHEAYTLLMAGADPSDDHNLAIRNAAENGHLEIVRLLLADERVDPSDNHNFAIQWAAENGHLEVVKLLLTDMRTDPSANHNDAIRIAAWNGHLDVVKVLLTDDRVDPSDKNNEAIRMAAWFGYLEIVNLLLSDSRVDPSDEDNDPIRNYAIRNAAIRKAAKNGHLDVVKVLLTDNRVDPSDNHNEAIRKAAKNGHLDVVKLLLKDPRVDPSDKDNYAIRKATKYGHHDVVKLLLLENENGICTPEKHQKCEKQGKECNPATGRCRKKAKNRQTNTRR